MAFDKDSVTGLFGFGAQGKRVVADTAGFFGFSAGRATNLIITFQPPASAATVRPPLTITITYAGNSLLISYNPDFPRLERQLPVNTPITITTSSTYYEQTSTTFQIGTNEVANKLIVLNFSQPAITTITEIFYL